MNKSPDTGPEQRLLRSYRQLPSTEPSATVDARILAHASNAVRRQQFGGQRWVWPLSAAAAVVVCVCLFFQIAQLMPRSTVIVLPPAESNRPDVAPALPSVGEESIAAGDSGTVTEEFLPQGLPPVWQDRLELAVESNDSRQFAADYRRMREQGISASLPAHLRRWALQQGLGDLINDG